MEASLKEVRYEMIKDLFHSFHVSDIFKMFDFSSKAKGGGGGGGGVGGQTVTGCTDGCFLLR